MTVNKLERFAEISESERVLEYTDYQTKDTDKPNGRWAEDVFENSNPVTLELACGTGAYTLELARRHPDRNYVGIDIKGARIWKGVKKAQKEQLSNVRFMRMFIDHLNEYFAEGEVDEIWITFADPFPSAGNRSRRLTSPKFLEQYRQVLSPGGSVHFKTDDDAFFSYTCRRVNKSGGLITEKVPDIYSDHPENELLTIQTTFEKKHLKNDKTISYCRFTFP